MAQSPSSTVEQLLHLQRKLDDFGEPLSQTTFVTVDLETTGGSPVSSQITEIGAVKTRGGEVIGEFQTLVNPGLPIPPMIVALTGITDAMVIAAPPIEEVLPAFLEFLGDAVLVAHNAPFDTGFLRAACRTHGYKWPGSEVVDTVTLARRATTKEEAPNKKLSTLARVFGTEVTPNHRALQDARATAEIMHKMFERLAAFGITHREDLDALRNPMPETRAQEGAHGGRRAVQAGRLHLPRAARRAALRRHVQESAFAREVVLHARGAAPRRARHARTRGERGHHRVRHRARGERA